eukprot:Filipodium_phascolosomae@DN1240_c0_g1_i2.p1
MRAIGSCAGTLRYGRRVPGALPSFLRGCGSLLVPPYAATATISSVALWDYFANRRQTKPNDPLTDSPDTSSTTASATTTTTTSASSTPPSPKFWYPYEPEPWRPADASLNKGFNRLDQFPRRARGRSVLLRIRAGRCSASLVGLAGLPVVPADADLAARPSCLRFRLH